MDQVERLLNLSDEEFRDVVDRDLRLNRDNRTRDPDSSVLWGLLNEDRDESCSLLADRWVGVLTAMSRSAEGQLAARRADLNAARAQHAIELNKTVRNNDPVRESQLQDQWLSNLAQYESQRGKTLRFKTGLDETLVHARRVADHHDRARVLEDSIRKHRNVLLADNEEVSDADEELWETVQ